MIPKCQFFVFLGASSCVKLNQLQEAITWCEQGLVVSFIADATTKSIDQIQILINECLVYKKSF